MASSIFPFKTGGLSRLTATALLVALPVIALCLSGAFDAARAQTATQKTFATPEAAVEALVKSLNAVGAAKIKEVLGSEHQDILIGGDEAAARENRKRAGAAATEYAALREAGDGRRIVIIGKKRWPVPIPIVKAGDRWYFDTAAGLDELVDRRVGRNELHAIKLCRQYITAQIDYAKKDRDGDQVREFAQQIISDEGKRNGLYWNSREGEELSPFGPLISDARNYIEGKNIGDPFKGYYFRIITRQDASAIGGRYDYIINGNMIAGFALIAFPADHDNSGIMTFICSHARQIYQKDLGPDGDLVAGATKIFNPDSSWTLVKE